MSATSQYSDQFQRLKNHAEAVPLDLTSNNEEWFNQKFTMDELNHSLNSFQKNKTPGPDNIPLLFLKEMNNNSKLKLLSIFNKIWEEQVYAKIWSTAIVIPILKPGKSKYELDSYRPIALTCIMCKVMEKMITYRLNQHLEQNGFLSNAQCGFRRNRSTQDQINNIAHDIKTAFSEKKDQYSIFFDIQKAYDKTWRLSVLQQLLKAGIKGRSAIFIQNYLQNRTIQVRINTTLSNTTVIENGVPQGGVLSIICFLLAINSIVQVIPQPLKCRLFADDLNISITT